MSELKFSIVPLRDVIQAKGRLDANVFNMEARTVISKLQSDDFKTWSITDSAITNKVYYPGRFKRKYVSESVGLPFILPSQISDLEPKPYKWIAGLSDKQMVELVANEGDILLTRSGTIGQSVIVGKRLAGCVLSDDLIRINVNDQYRGYLYAFLRSKTGQLLLKTSNYGAVVQHIEPDHLSEIEVPFFDRETVRYVNDQMLKSVSLLNAANDALQKAREQLQAYLGISSRVTQRDEVISHNGIEVFELGRESLNNRLDASYHSAISREITRYLRNEVGVKLVRLEDSGLAKDVILPGRFKRVYVGDEFGVPFIGGKEILSLDPRTGKNLSLTSHGPRIKEQLKIKQNQVLITCSGTIGKVSIAPKHWEGWAASQHIIRIEPQNSDKAALLYLWLSSPHGRNLIQQQTYGSVVNEIDSSHVKDILVPELPNTVTSKLAKLVLDANDMRTEAFQIEEKMKLIFDDKLL